MTWLKRPLGLSALFAALVLSGLFCWRGLSVELLPRLAVPSLTVITSYQNATPEEINTLVTTRLEGVLGTVSGVERIQSSSREGYSLIRLGFPWGRDLNAAAADVREKLDAAAGFLPKETDPPLVLHYDPAARPLLVLALTGGKNLLAMRELAADRIKPGLENIAGAAEVRISGGLKPEVQVLVDRGRLVAHSMSLKQVVEAVGNANFDFPGGELSLRGLAVPLRTVGRFMSAAQIGSAPLPAAKGVARATLSEVARVVEGHADRTGFARVGGRPAVLLSVFKSPEAGPVDLSRRLAAKAASLAATLPPGWRLTVVDDSAPLVARAIGNLGLMAALGGVLAAAVLWLFLGGVRRAGLVVLCLPISVLGTLGVLHLAGRGLNLMSIGGLALGVGMLVDASIVVLESMVRHHGAGGDRLNAARSALRETGGGLAAGTLTVAAALSPIFFLTGLPKSLFADFAFSLITSLVIALGSALFLLPALFVWLGAGKPRRRPAGRPGRAAAWYRRALVWALRRGRLTVVLGLAATALGLALVCGLDSTLLPDLESNLVRASLTLPAQSSLAGLESAAARAERALMALPGVIRVVTRGGTEPGGGPMPGLSPGRRGRAEFIIAFKPGSKGMAGVSPAMARVAASIPGARAETALGRGLLSPGGGGALSPQLVILTGREPAPLLAWAGRVMKRLKAGGQFIGLGSQGLETAPQLQVKVDRRAAALTGLNVARLARGVNRAVAGEVAGELIAGDGRRDIRVRLYRPGKRLTEGLASLPFPAPGGKLVYLGQVASLMVARGPREILRFNRRRAVVIRGSAVGLALSRAQSLALAVAGGEKPPAGCNLRGGVEGAEMERSLATLASALALALLFAFVILLVRLESFARAGAIMAAMPPLIIGPAAGLTLLGIHLNALVLVAGVLLVGLAVNAMILLAESAGRLMERGWTPGRAMLAAAAIRVKPLLLSVLTTIAGALPLALGWGASSAVSRGLAVTVACGLIASLACTLFLAPVLLVLFTRRGRGGGLK